MKIIKYNNNKNTQVIPGGTEVKLIQFFGSTKIFKYRHNDYINLYFLFDSKKKGKHILSKIVFYYKALSICQARQNNGILLPFKSMPNLFFTYLNYFHRTYCY